MALDYLYIFILFSIGAIFSLICVLIPFRFGSCKTTDETPNAAEPAWIKTDAYSYTCTVIFLAVAVEAAFLAPVLIVFRRMPGWPALAQVALFMGLLAFAVLYAWKNGYLECKQIKRTP